MVRGESSDRRRASRGYSLVELMVASAVLALLAALGFGALSRMQAQSAVASANSELLTSLRQCRAEAFGRGATVVFVLDSLGGRWWMVSDPNSNFSLEAFAPATPALGGDVLLGAGTLPAGMAIAPSSGFGELLPPPFASVPAGSACTFCVSVANPGFGAISFRPSGGARFSGGDLRGGSFTLQGPSTGGVPAAGTRGPVTLAVNARTGATTLFDRRLP